MVTLPSSILFQASNALYSYYLKVAHDKGRHNIDTTSGNKSEISWNKTRSDCQNKTGGNEAGMTQPKPELKQNMKITYDC